MYLKVYDSYLQLLRIIFKIDIVKDKLVGSMDLKKICQVQLLITRITAMK